MITGMFLAFYLCCSRFKVGEMASICFGSLNKSSEESRKLSNAIDISCRFKFRFTVMSNIDFFKASKNP